MYKLFTPVFFSESLGGLFMKLLWPDLHPKNLRYKTIII